jgi:flagellar hook-associated protein 2
VTSAVDGLVSGLSTTSLISQLMQVESAPQTRLKTKVSTAQTAVASYLSVNAKMASVQTAGHTIGLLSTWRALKATSSSPTVTATATANNNSATGTLTFDVEQLATKQATSLKVTTHVDGDHDGTLDTAGAPITTADSITVTPGKYTYARPVDTTGDGVLDDSDAEVATFVPGTPVVIDISTTDKSADGIAQAINNKGIGVKASVLKTSAGTGVLQFSSTKTGADNGFQIGGLDGAGLDEGSGPTSPATTTPRSATIKLTGGGGTNFEVSSNTNTFADLMPGLTITVSKVESGVTVDAASDVDGLADQFQALVDAANATLTEIGTQTAYDPSTNKGSPLTGDFSVRNMSQKLLGKISQGLSWPDPASTAQNKLPDKVFGAFKKLGITIIDGGQLQFNKQDFIDAYNADPAKIQEAGIKFGDQMDALAGGMVTNLSKVVTGRKGEIDGINDQISNWDVRLAAKKTALQKQYSDLEVSLGKLKNQSNWLSGQLAGLG